MLCKYVSNNTKINYDATKNNLYTNKLITVLARMNRQIHTLEISLSKKTIWTDNQHLVYIINIQERLNVNYLHKKISGIRHRILALIYNLTTIKYSYHRRPKAMNIRTKRWWTLKNFLKRKLEKKYKLAKTSNTKQIENNVKVSKVQEKKKFTYIVKNNNRISKKRVNIYKTSKRNSLKKFREIYANWLNTAPQTNKPLYGISDHLYRNNAYALTAMKLLINLSFRKVNLLRSALNRQLRPGRVKLRLLRNTLAMKNLFKHEMSANSINIKNIKSTTRQNIIPKTNTSYMKDTYTNLTHVSLLTRNKTIKNESALLVYSQNSVKQWLSKNNGGERSGKKFYSKLNTLKARFTETNLKKTLSTILFNYNATQLYTNATNSSPIIGYLNTPELTSNNTWKNSTNQILKNFAARDEQRQSLEATSVIKLNSTAAQLTNYLPIQLYKFKNTNPRNSTSSVMVTGISLRANQDAYKVFFTFFAVTFLEKFVHKKVWIKLDMRNPFNSFWKRYIFRFCKSNGYAYKKFSKLLPYRELLEIIILSFKMQDAQIFLKFLKNKFETSHFKKHKKILSILFDILRKNRALFTLTPVKGFSFDIRGKVGVSGNAKKRHVFFSYGKISTTSQNLKSVFQQIEVWTPTGQMGITCYMVF